MLLASEPDRWFDNGGIMNRGKITILGDAGVGKTSLISQLRNGYYPSNHEPTIEDTCYHRFNSSLIEIVDTKGAACYQSLRPRWIKDSDMILVVFNDVVANSLAEAEDILVHHRGSCPAMLVRNKVERTCKEDLSAKALAARHGCVYVELSATDGDQVHRLFVVATSLIEKRITITSDSDATTYLDRDRIRVTTTLEQESEYIATKSDWATSTPQEA